MASRLDPSPKCSNCATVLAGRKYMMQDNKLFCIPCFERECAHRCAACEKLIRADQAEVSYKENFYHDSCFSCTNCGLLLSEKTFADKNKKLICLDCYDKMSISKCHKCGLGFRNGQVSLKFDGKHWHEECFRCKHCQSTIGTEKFVSKDDGELCASCFENHFALKCTKCNEIIINGGVLVNGIPWHAACFMCQLCHYPLKDSTFVVKENEYYCNNCYNEKCVKQCSQCKKPIKGADGPRCVYFGGKSWHSGCFVCCRCDSNLNERGFVMSNDQLVCPMCAKNK